MRNTFEKKLFVIITKMFGIQIITAFFAFASHHSAYASSVSASTNKTGRLQVDQLRYDFFEFENNLWNDVSDKGRLYKNLDASVITEYHKFGNRIQERMVPNDIDNGFRILKEFSLHSTYLSLKQVNAMYKTFREFQVNRTKPVKEAWRDFNRTLLIVSEDFDLVQLKTVAYLSIKKNLFGQVASKLTNDLMCDLKQSYQQILYSLYNAIALAELQGHIMIQFSLLMNWIYKRHGLTTHSQLARELYQERSDDIIKSVHTVISSSSRDYWRCDPKKHVLGETYEEVTRLLQGFIAAEVSLNREGTCEDECSIYSFLEYADRAKNGKCGHNQKMCQQNQCIGKILGCKSMKSSRICLSDKPTYRRYQRKNQKCATSKATTVKDSFQWTVFPFYRTCSYCLCLCDQKNLSDRYVNMKATLADIKNNRVVTGLRFVKKNQIIHLQIQEAKLLPYGRIDAKTAHWVPVDNYTRYDEKPKVHELQHYHAFSWQNRAIDLDDIEADEGYLVTGVRFKAIGMHLNFEILTTPFAFDTGKLSIKHSVYKDNLNTTRTKIKLDRPDVPSLSESPSISDSKSGQYVELVNSDLEKDLGQTTVPFFDAQPVVSGQPLSGAGIFHKGLGGFGGFISPKLISYDFGKHIPKSLSGTNSQRIY